MNQQRRRQGPCPDIQARRAFTSLAHAAQRGTFMCMQQPNPAIERIHRRRTAGAAVAVTALSAAVALTLANPPANDAPRSVRHADIHLVTTDAPAPPEPGGNPAEVPRTVDPSPPPPSPPPASPAPGAPAPEQPGPASPAPGAPAPAADGRVDNAAGGFSFVPPQGWVQADARRLTYGSALLTNEAAPNGSILMGRLDLKLFAGAEPDNQKSATRLASDMGEFFMPYPGNRINQENETFDVQGMSAASSYYEVKFDDTNKENGQIWAAAVGSGKDRWFVVWLGTASSPIDKGVAKTLAKSIRPWTPPPAPAPGENPLPEGVQPPPEGEPVPAPGPGGAPEPPAPASPAPAGPAPAGMPV